MFIKSQFKDYYDSYQKYTSVESRSYNRHLVIKEYTPDISKSIKDAHLRPSFSQCIVGFCGTLYYGIEHKQVERPKYYRQYSIDKLYNYDRYICYNVDDFLANRYKNYNYEVKTTTETKRALSNCFQVVKDDSLFIQENTPIFIITEDSWNSNIIISHSLSKGIKVVTNKYQDIKDFSLLNFMFDKIVPSNLAYMEIESYIHNVLSREYKKVPEMSDQVKIGSHGFDKESFRKQKYEKG